MIQVNTENKELQYRCESNIMKILIDYKLSTTAQYDEIGNTLKLRNMTIENKSNPKNNKTCNKPIIDSVIEYVKEKSLCLSTILPTI